MRPIRLFLAQFVLCILVFAFTVNAQSTEFTYQGRLLDAGLPPTAVYDIEFTLWDSLVGGTQQGPAETKTGVSVTAGIFTVRLDFGAQFTGAARFLQIEVKPTGPGPFTLLAPRQPITSTPYAVKSLNADTAATATDASNLGGVPAADYVVTTDPRMTDDRNPTAGSANYIQNTASPQASSNFNISGNGTAGGTLSGNIVSAATQYNIGGNRILSNPGTDNLFAGVEAGEANTTGNNNSFFGRLAGRSNTTGGFNSFFGTNSGRENTVGSNNAFFGGFAGASNLSGSSNAFFGSDAGFSNTTGSANSFFGRNAGRNNTEGFSNSFFGTDAGFANTNGGGNSFFGRQAGQSNTTGTGNSFFGLEAGRANTTGGSNSYFGSYAGANSSGDWNSFVGYFSGVSNSTGSGNSFFGNLAGSSNTTGTNNTIIGFNADVSSGSLTNATAIGAGAVVATSNTIVLGRATGEDAVRVPGNLTVIGTFTANLPAGSGNYIQNTASPQASSNFNISGNGTAGGTLSGNIVNATTQYNIGGNRILSNPGTDNLFAGVEAGEANTTGNNNSFFGRLAGRFNTTGGFNSFFGTNAGRENTVGSNNAFFGRSAGQDNTTGTGNSFFGLEAGRANTTGGSNSYFGSYAGANSSGDWNSFVGYFSGVSNSTGSGNSFFGNLAGSSNTTGTNNTIIGYLANVSAGGLTFATAIGSQAVVTSSNQVQIGRNGSDTVRIGTLAAATATQLCINASNVLAACSSSARYKENIRPFNGGLNLVNRLRPVTYDWIEGQAADLGLIAEEVEKVEPLLVTYNGKGEIQGVKYDQITVALINAVKEQQTLIERQQKQIDALRKMVCKQTPTGEGCKEEK